MSDATADAIISGAIVIGALLFVALVFIVACIADMLNAIRKLLERKP